MPKKKAYVVFEGRKPGIYDSWKECEEQVSGFSGSKYKGFFDKKTAIQEYETYQKENLTKNVSSVKFSNVNTTDVILYNTFSVDGACSNNPGDGEFQCVHTKTREVVFRSKIYTYVTNNLMEYLALVKTLKYCIENKIDKKIYSDSISAIAWIKNKKVETTLEKNYLNNDCFKEVSYYEEWVKSVNVDLTAMILKWDTEKWGEIPADFGRK